MMHIALLVANVLAVVGVATVYATIANWKKYSAGRAIMWLLWALSAAIIYWLLARFVPQEMKWWLSNGTGIFMLLTVLGVGRVMVVEQIAGHKKRALVQAHKSDNEGSE